MKIILSIFIFLLSYFILSKYSKILNLIDKPNKRKNHSHEVPIVGGLSILISLSIFFYISQIHSLVNLIFYFSIIIFITGMIDDFLRLGVLIRLFVQLICSICLVYYGLEITSLGKYEFFNNIYLGLFSSIFTVISIVLMSNAINWIDGVDGLATSMFLQSLLSINIFIHILGLDNSISHISIILIVNCILFILINLGLSPFQRGFLGNSGSIFLGFLLSCISIYYVIDTNYLLHPIIIAWCISFPIFNITATVIKRILNKKNPFEPDRLHLHHVLQDMMISDRNVLLILFTFSCCMSFIGGFSYLIFGPIYSLNLFIIAFIAYVLIIIFRVSRL